MMHRLASLLLVATVAHAQCPNGFLHHGEYCYSLPGTTATWAQATMYCTVLGSDLAVIESAAEQAYLIGFLQRMAGAFPGDKDFWIGGGDFLEHGTWIWIKSQNLIDSEASFWATGQPASASQHQACLRMSEAVGYKWEAGSCDSPEYFICKKPFAIGDSGVPVGK